MIQYFILFIFSFSIITGIVLKVFLMNLNKKQEKIIYENEIKYDKILEIQKFYAESESLFSELKSQKNIINIMGNLGKITPKNLYLTEFDIKKNQFQIKGVSEQGRTLPDFLEKLEKLSEKQFIIQETKKNDSNRFFFDILSQKFIE